MDTTAIVATITACIAPVTAIGIAVLGVIVAAKTFKWVRAAL